MRVSWGYVVDDHDRGRSAKSPETTESRIPDLSPTAPARVAAATVFVAPALKCQVGIVDIHLFVKSTLVLIRG
jgi:hypothetical protein